MAKLIKKVKDYSKLWFNLSIVGIILNSFWFLVIAIGELGYLAEILEWLATSTLISLTVSVVFPIVGTLLSFFALVFGIKSYKQSKDLIQKKQSLRAIILGSVGLILGIIYAAFWILVVIVFAPDMAKF